MIQTKGDQFSEIKVLKVKTKMHRGCKDSEQVQTTIKWIQRLNSYKIFNRKGAALWCQGHQSVATLCVNLAGRANTLVAREWEH